MSEPHHDLTRPTTEREESEIRISDYFWRPLWVKLWWTAAALFWIGVVLISWLPIHVSLDADHGWQFWLALVFHPFLIVPVLGYRVAWAWRRDKALFPWDTGYSDPPRDTDRVDGLYNGTGVGFHRPTSLSYMSDPTDVRSPVVSHGVV